jgi:uncharacterized protein (TIGR00255 family)
MTAFARTEEAGEWGSATFEIRSVNHRYLDINFKLPDKLRHLEMELKKMAEVLLSRGKVDVYLRFHEGEELDRDIVINARLVDALMEVEKTFQRQTGKSDALSLEKLITWPGAFEMKAANMDVVYDPLMAIFEESLLKLNQVREGEGERLVCLIAQRLEKIREEVDKASDLFERSIGKQKERIYERYEQLSLDLDGSRVEQEIVLMLQRLDVTEELDRLIAHVDEVESILKTGGVVGRRLDFLMQELNREANTLSSKSQDPALTKVAVEIKVLIEQMREQVQNIA